MHAPFIYMILFLENLHCDGAKIEIHKYFVKTQKHEIIRVLSQNQVDIHLFKNLHIHAQLLINQMTFTEFFATETT